jgi:hypothetical protein
MDVTASSAIIVFRNMSILRDRYAPSRPRFLQVGMPWKIAIGFDKSVAQFRAMLIKFKVRKRVGQTPRRSRDGFSFHAFGVPPDFATAGQAFLSFAQQRMQ